MVGDMMVIHKFTIDTRTEEITLPKYAEILSCIIQRGKICIYALVDNTFPKVTRNVYCIGTGQELEREWSQKVDFIGTVSMHDGDLIWHVFIDKELKT